MATRIATNQVLYNLMNRGIEWDLLPWCRSRSIPVMAYSPFVSAPPALTRLLGNAALKTVAARHDATPAQIALAWLLHQPGVVAIPKAVQPAHVRANRAAYDLALTPDDLKDLDARLPAATQEGAAGDALAACAEACRHAAARLALPSRCRLLPPRRASPSSFR